MLSISVYCLLIPISLDTISLAYVRDFWWISGAYYYTAWICNFINSPISLFIYLSDTDSIAPFENNTSINLINLLCILLFSLIGVVLSNGAVLSVSDKYDSVNERTQEISESMKLHILGGRMPVKFIRQPASLYLRFSVYCM